MDATLAAIRASGFPIWLVVVPPGIALGCAVVSALAPRWRKVQLAGLAAGAGAIISGLVDGFLVSVKGVEVLTAPGLAQIVVGGLTLAVCFYRLGARRAPQT